MNDEHVTKLLYLKELHEKGVLTAERLAAEKAKILGETAPSSDSFHKKESPIESEALNTPKLHKKSNKKGGLIAACSIGVLVIIAGIVNFCGPGRMSEILKESEKPKVYGKNRKSKDYIKERLTWIYSAALEGVSGNKEKLKSANMYKSSQMKKLEKQCAAVEQSEPGYLRDWYMDCVDWIFTQDLQNPRLASVSVKSITNDSAEATVVIDVFGDSESMQHVDLWLVYENNDWYIDDFQPDEYKEFKHTVRDDMDVFLKSHKK